MRTGLALGTLVGLLATAAAAAAGGDALIGDLEGVYKVRHRSGLIAPGKDPGEADQKVTVEDIVEIVRHDADSIYLRAELSFYNGHTCSISGIAIRQGSAFVYRSGQFSGEGAPPCTLT